MMADFNPDAYLAGPPSGGGGGGFDPDQYLKDTAHYGALESGLEGYLKGASANWRDEIYGASKASGLPDWMGGFRAPVGAARLAYEHYTQPGKNLSSLVTGDSRGPVQKEYERFRDEKRRQEEEMQRQNPLSFGAGELGGAAADMILPGMAGVRAAAPAATVAGRIGQSAAAGAGYGALAGAGEGEGAAGTAAGTVSGGLTGAALGTVGGGLAEAAAPLVSPIVKKASGIYHGLVDPEGEAIRRYAAVAQRDAGSAGEKLTPQDLLLAQHVGMPIGAVDTAGQGVRELARTASNFSPEAQAALKQFTQDRFEEQSPRIAGFIRELTGGADAVSDAGAIEAAARAANRPAYKTAYQAGETGIWTPELERLSGIPPVRKAMERAVENARTWAGAEGYGAFNPGVTFENGVMQFGRGRGAPPYPNMQYWDYVQRELRDMKDTAARGGERGMATALGNIHKQLVGELDAAVPEFQTARRGAAAFFGADNALEAGAKFVRPPASMTPKDALAQQRAFARMKPAEKELFARGYASRLADEVERAGDNRNVLIKDFFNSAAGRQRTQLALGPGRAQQLEALLRVEGIVDQARTALGNSTTARQMIAAAAFGAGGDYAAEGHFDPSHMLVSALAGAGLPHAYKQVGQLVSGRVAAQLGRLLTSNNPIDLAKGVKIAARDAAVMQRLRQLTAVGITGPGTEAIAGNKPNKGFKHGGAALPEWLVKVKAKRGPVHRAGGGLTEDDDNDIARAMTPPPTMWQKATPEINRKSGEVADVIGNTGRILGAPIINQAERMGSAFEHGIDWEDPEQVKETSGGTLLDMMGLVGGTAGAAERGTVGALGGKPGLMAAAQKAVPLTKDEQVAREVAARLSPDQKRDLISHLYGDAHEEREAAQMSERASSLHQTEQEHGFYMVNDPEARARDGLPPIPENAPRLPSGRRAVPGGPLDPRPTAVPANTATVDTVAPATAAPEMNASWLDILKARQGRASGGRIWGELPPSQKASHEEVNYQSVSPRAKQHCRDCTKFIPAEQGGPACRKVASPILPGAWCKRFVRKAD